MISVRKAKHLDVTTMFTYSHANTPLGQSEHVYYLSYFIKVHVVQEIVQVLKDQSVYDTKFFLTDFGPQISLINNCALLK